MMKKYLLLALPSIIIISLFYILKPSNQDINKEIKTLKEENKLLKRKNDTLLLTIKDYDVVKKQSDEKISNLEKNEKKEIEKIENLDKKINQLKDKYEKARNHSANFNTIDVQRYFADSLNF